MIRRLFVVLGLTFIVALFLVCYPFAAIWFVITGQDLTAKIERFLDKEKRRLF